ncbi:hypothetical protein BWQ93_15460 [Sphingopyxis sp. QXT-31]|nr:hypothetical protein BWQ93_15460 [Sphingopyxis sp. QXT-31]
MISIEWTEIRIDPPKAGRLLTAKDRTKLREERAFALMALGHWIGDIHQPLHHRLSRGRYAPGQSQSCRGEELGRDGPGGLGQ